MRRSICYCEPSNCLAGEQNTWKFIYTTAVALPKGTALKFVLGIDGRAIDWEIPFANSRKDQNVIYASLKNGTTISMTEVVKDNHFVPDYEFILPSKLSAGEQLTITMGAPKSKAKGKTLITKGTQTQTFTQRRKPFYLYIDPTGKKRFNDPEIFNIDVRGNVLHTIRILAPSFVLKNRRFDVVIRFEDEFGNLTNNAPEDTMIELSYKQLRESLSWQLFLPETGVITLPNLYFNDEGIHTIHLKNKLTNESFTSPPIRCFSKDYPQLFWGLLHGESEKFNATQNIERCLRHLRDEEGVQFFSTSCFENQEETTNDIWKSISNTIAEFNEEDRFTSFLGFQWIGQPKTEGIRQFVFAKDHKSLLRGKDSKYSSLKKIYKLFTPKDFISIPCMTMGKGSEYDFKNYSPEFERVVEIYNSWGSSESTQKSGNPCPIKGKGKQGMSECKEGSIQSALKANCRFGFIAGGLDDRGVFEGLFEAGQTQYPPGLTAIMAKNHTREALFEALYKRYCYATTGEKIILGFNIANMNMGTELSTATKPGLLVNRYISGFVSGTDDIALIEIIRNGDVIQEFKPKTNSYEFEFDDENSLEKVAIQSKGNPTPFAYYYLRVTQMDGHMAWSSPIWVDLHPPLPKPEIKKSK